MPVTEEDVIGVDAAVCNATRMEKVEASNERADELEACCDRWWSGIGLGGGEEVGDRDGRGHEQVAGIGKRTADGLQARLDD